MIQDVVVILDHPHGKIEVLLEEWMRMGPGDRKFIKPIAAKCAKSEKALPLSIVPFRYRNNTLSRMLISLKLLSNPWPK